MVWIIGFEPMLRVPKTRVLPSYNYTQIKIKVAERMEVESMLPTGQAGVLTAGRTLS
jgi:hypothetical protein